MGVKNTAYIAFALALSASLAATGQTTQPIATVRVDTTPGHQLNAFDPDAALGSTIDVLSKSEIDHVYTPELIAQCLSAGWGPISFRNNSELRMAAWHWNSNGTWSDPSHQCGYFTGSTDLKQPLRYAVSYNLPHRGFATSGDSPLPGATTYWKSNPYLTSHFTGESDALHPQWVVVDMKSAKPVDAIRIAWVSPYAVVYRVEYWQGKGDALDFDDGPDGKWIAFPKGAVTDGHGGTVTLTLADSAIPTRFVRILMTQSSNTPDEQGPADIRDCVGYAIQSIQLGILHGGQLVDANPATRPTGRRRRGGITFCVSSIDPWHAATNAVADGSEEHTGFDLFFTSGLTNHLPATIPVTLLYGTPEDAAAEIAYLEKRHYPIAGVEMGEEPDGKHCLPEDYAALYIQAADAIHKIDPKVKLGGPIFEGVTDDITVWPDAQGRISWMGRFVDYLKSHGHLADLAFVSFEHYPFDRDATWKSYYDEPQLTQHILQVWRDDGVPANVPLMITESSMAADLIGSMSRIESATWLCDSVGSFFASGGTAYFHSPIQPQGISARSGGTGSASWSNFILDRQHRIRGYTAFYWAARMINFEWAPHHAGTDRMFPSSVHVKDADGNDLVTSYALQWRDGQWAVMLVNRDRDQPHAIRINFAEAAGQPQHFISPVRYVTFGSDQYVWQDHGVNSFASPDGPPLVKTVPGGADASYILPRASITIIRGKVN
ncbi:MAG TPA: discoidin domain-containing protein [Tepidisphaeraceae bacterium]|nr:discoidin domain-containing protein [Tepidisphaeraceae bacterium]